MEVPLHHASTISRNRASALKSASKLLVAVVLGLGTLVSSAILAISNHDDDGSPRTNHYLRETSSFIRSLEELTSKNATSATSCDLDCCMEFESSICGSENEWISAIPFAISIILIILLISLSALFSGLTLGLMSLDMTGLEIVMSGDDPKAARYAKVIYPIREDGNLLLCTLLLGNVAVNSLLSIFLSVYAGGIIGFIASTFLIVIFGEIVPQAVCSRYALRIGSATVPVVRVIRLILFPVAKPLAFCLDLSLGRELATTYTNAEMMKLLQIHVQENVLDKETAGAMTGALTYKNVPVKNVMTPMERVFMLCVDDKLSFETIAKIFKTGYSRIPIYEVTKDNVIGLLFVKDLIFIDPEDEVPIRSFVQIFGRGVHVVWPDDTLGDVLAELKKGRSHLALVRDVDNSDPSRDPFYEVKGIITLEDIIEKIIGDTIVDETDAFMDNTQLIKVERDENFEWARLRLLDTKIVDGMLSSSEVQAVTAHFRVNFADTVKWLTDTQLKRLVSNTPVVTYETAKQELGKELPDELLYRKGDPSDHCTLVLSGKITIMVGAEKFRSDLSAWSVLGKPALENPNFVPDFSAYVSDGPCRCLQLNRAAFAEAVDASAVERHATENKVGQKVEPVRSPSADMEMSPVPSADNMSNSSDVPNRRSKLIEAILGKGSKADPPEIPVVLDRKPSAVRFEDSTTVRTKPASESASTETKNDGPNDQKGEPPESKPPTTKVLSNGTF